MNQNLQKTLHTLSQHPTTQLAFVMHEQGSLIAWAGDSLAFSPTGQFSRRGPEEDEENLYMVLLEPSHYLGVLFTEGSDVEEVRAWIKSHEAALQQALSPTPEPPEGNP